LYPAIDKLGFIVRAQDHERGCAFDTDRVAVQRGEIGDVFLVISIGVSHFLPGALGQIQKDGQNADPFGQQPDHFHERRERNC
jgi:hypothetical protein